MSLFIQLPPLFSSVNSVALVGPDPMFPEPLRAHSLEVQDACCRHLLSTIFQRTITRHHVRYQYSGKAKASVRLCPPQGTVRFHPAEIKDAGVFFLASAFSQLEPLASRHLSWRPKLLSLGSTRNKFGQDCFTVACADRLGFSQSKAPSINRNSSVCPSR